MRKFQCLLLVLKQSYICYDIICMAVTLKDLLSFEICAREACKNIVYKHSETIE